LYMEYMFEGDSKMYCIPNGFYINGDA
jgi:hypothetical protein